MIGRGQAVRLLTGDARQVLASLPAASADCVVTSPPYFGLRDYGDPGQYGLEATPQDYADNLCAVFQEIRRVLTPDGTAWLNLGDRYSGGIRHHDDTHSGKAHGRGLSTSRVDSGPGKNLLGIPWRVAFTLQQDGWLLRSAIVWHKPNAMPESVRDRMACRHETIFLLTQRQHHWFDAAAILERHGHRQDTPNMPQHGNHPADDRSGNSARTCPDGRRGNEVKTTAARRQHRATGTPARCRGCAACSGGQVTGDV